jgi:ABC-type molybdate transport system, ATPase component
MNRVSGTIVRIDRRAPFNMVELDTGKGRFTVLTLGLGGSFLEGKRAAVVFKEGDIVLVKGQPGAVSADNRMPGTVKSLKEGEVLAEVEINASFGVVRALISAGAKERMKLAPGDDVEAFINASEVSLLAEEKA